MKNCIDLPHKFLKTLPFNQFNKMQSKMFWPCYKENENLVVSAPTASGKTTLFDFCIFRAINNFSDGQYKVVYIVPLKALVNERKLEWF